MVELIGLRLRLRDPFGLGFDGYVPAYRSACLRQAGVSARRRELLETTDITESCPERRSVLREPQDERRRRDERRVEGDETGIVTVRRCTFSN